MYTIVTGNNNSNFMSFVGQLSLYSQTLVNPYTGFSIYINEEMMVNNAIYDGLGGMDTLSMTAFGDVLTLLDANGTIMIKSIEIINASSGGDIINFAFLGALYGNVNIRGAGGDDILWGNAGNDVLNGADGNDNLIGGYGNDQHFGGNDDDYIDGSLGTDYLAGGAGDDHLVYSVDATWTGGLTLASLGSFVPFAALIHLDGKNRTHDTFHGDATDTNEVFETGIDTITMTAGSDVLLGMDMLSPQIGPFTQRVTDVEVIEAGDGDDIVDLSMGIQGDLHIDGGAGNDVLAGNQGNDTILGGSGDDIIFGSIGDDHLYGGSGNDTYYYNLGDGSDTITETSGTDKMVFGEGIVLSDLTLSISDQDLLVNIGASVITIKDHFASDLSGRVESFVFADGSVFDASSYGQNEAPEAKDDVLSGYRNGIISGNVLADNGNGTDSDVNDDFLSVHAGTITTIYGGTVELLEDGSFTYTPAVNFFGQDSFEYTLTDGQESTTAIVTLHVELNPEDSIIGTNGNDNLDGSDGDDEIFGLDGDDTLKGQNGSDTIFGGAGNDILYGDDGILTGHTYDKAFSDIQLYGLKERVNIADLLPPATGNLGFAEGNLTVDYDATASITFRNGYAGYNNSFGSYGIAADGTLVSSTMHWANVKSAGFDTTHVIDLPVGADGGSFGFFIIGNGDSTNNGYAGLNITGEGNISFVYNYGKKDARDAKITDVGSKITVLYDDGVTVQVLKGNVFFSTERDESSAINRDGKTHIVSGLVDLNNLTLDQKKVDIGTKQVSFTKNGITVEAILGTLVANGDKIGVAHASGGNVISGVEGVAISFAASSESVKLSLSDIAGGNTGIDFKIYVEGSSTPISYEYAVGAAPSGGKIDIVLNADDFGGLITKIIVSSTANSALGVETFYIDNVHADIPGGIDTNTLRIGFEDLYNTGDADYEDVLFDLDINPKTVGDLEGGNDILDGGAGNDILYGEGGNDILVIGDGADHAFGGTGADIFAITKIDGDVDTIHDFNMGEGDSINIADVLSGYDALTMDIAAFVQIVQNGGNADLRINASGADDGAFITAATIIGGAGLSLSSLLSGGYLEASNSALS